jgi:hypothetical protein
LEPKPIPLASDQFPDEGDRLLFSSENPFPKAARKIILVVERSSK